MMEFNKVSQETWSQLGLMESVPTEKKTEAVNLYNGLLDYTTSKKFEILVNKIQLEKWWNKNNAEECQFSLDNANLIFYAVGHELLKKSNEEVTLNKLLKVIESVEFENEDLQEAVGLKELIKTASSLALDVWNKTYNIKKESNNE